jgi:hypothetical protein
VDIDMTDQNIELLSQYIDGELPAAEAQALRKRLLTDLQLRAQLDRMQTVDNSVKAAFDMPGAAEVPARITQMVENTTTSTGGLSAQHRAGWGLAIAASLLAATGLLLAPQWQQPSGELPSGDALLADTLENSPSRAQGWETLADGSHMRPLLSFPDSRGGWCREYLLSSQDNTWRGVACRNSGSGQWITEVRSPDILAGSTTEYRPAGAANPGQITAFINTHSADIAVSLKQEADLIAHAWQ